jgi:hypothetical protein
LLIGVFRESFFHICLLLPNFKNILLIIYIFPQIQHRRLVELVQDVRAEMAGLWLRRLERKANEAEQRPPQQQTDGIAPAAVMSVAA